LIFYISGWNSSWTKQVGQYSNLWTVCKGLKDRELLTDNVIKNAALDRMQSMLRMKLGFTNRQTFKSKYGLQWA